MFPVPAPAADCDFSEGHEPDNAPNKTGLKLVASTSPNADRDDDPSRDPGTDTQAEAASETGAADDSQQTTSETDPSSLAARILQMHAASGELQPRQTRRPQLVGTSEDSAFDMPGVLQRPASLRRSAGLNPDPVPVPKATTRVSDRLRNGPSFGALVLSTLLIVAAGTGAVLFGLTDLLAGKPVDDKIVTTQLIETQPTIESLIAESEAGSLGRSNLTGTPSASAQQVAKAKDRIRQAFAAGSKPSAAPEDLARPLGAPEKSSGDDKIQTRLTPAQPQAVAVRADASQFTSPPPASADALADVRNAEPTRPGLEPEEISYDASAVGVTAPEAEPLASPGESLPNAGKITVSVNLRQSRDKNAQVIAVVPANSTVNVGACGPWWCEITFDGKQGFVGQKYVERQQ
jgi:hypothetical protein